MKLRFSLFSFFLIAHLLTFAQPHKKSSVNKAKKKSSLSSSHKSNSVQKNASGSSVAPVVTTPSSDVPKKNVTGIWKGYFVQSVLGFTEDKYRFEVQVAEKDNHSLQAVTYSYKTTVFYGKAEATGIYTAKSKNFLLKEINLVDVKLADNNSGACLMTCYLDYDKQGGTETLSGTYSSVSVKDKTDCGMGKVYLEKTPVTDFYKEDFLVKRENELRKKDHVVSNSPKKNPAETAKKTKPNHEIKPGAEDNFIAKQKKEPVQVHDKAEPAKPDSAIVKSILVPEKLKTRSNDLLQTIVTSEKEIKIELYDNGEIDGDRISVYHNNQLIVSNQLLTDKPITFTFHADEKTPVHNFVMVAENLGTIPPNTSLMIVTAGTQRHEVFVQSNEQKNALVTIQYKADDAASNK